MKLYLSGRYGRRIEIQTHAQELEVRGHEIVSRWIDGAHEAADAAPTPDEANRWADDDLTELEQAEVFVLFTECDAHLQRSRGGRFVELGYALARKTFGPLMGVVLVGPREANIFTHLEDVDQVENVTGLVRYLNDLEAGV